MAIFGKCGILARAQEWGGEGGFRQMHPTAEAHKWGGEGDFGRMCPTGKAQEWGGGGDFRRMRHTGRTNKKIQSQNGDAPKPASPFFAKKFADILRISEK